jgi:hypothetical protein
VVTRALFSLLVAVPVVGLAAPVQASCFQTAIASADKFTGTVTATSNKGRTATVRTDDGKTVTVMGSEAAEPNSATTVDRSFAVGTRYEFHPVNDTDPYLDNACTATHAIGAGGVGAGGGGGAEQSGTLVFKDLGCAAVAGCRHGCGRPCGRGRGVAATT